MVLVERVVLNQEAIEKFFVGVETNIKNKMHYRDAIELSAVVEGGDITAQISQAMAKYQEAIHPQTELFAQKNSDELAILSMGVLWEEEYFNPLEEAKRSTLAEAIYLIMKYGKEEDGFTKALEANGGLVGNVEGRQKMIKRVLECYETL